MASGIQIGDAVLKMFVDWTDIDKVASDLPSHLKPGSDAAAALGKTFDVVGSSAAAAGTQASLAGRKIGDAGKQGAAGLKSADEASQGLVARIKALEAESVVLQQQVQQLQAKLQQLGPAGEDAGRRMGRGMNEAAAEAGLLGEAFGIRLPRHVRTFVSELPGLSTALSAAFSATAIYFVIEAVVQLGEKIAEYVNSQKEIADAWQQTAIAGQASLLKLDDGVISAQEKIDDLTHNYLGALKDQLTLIDHASLRELGTTFDDFSKQVSADFEKMESYSVWDFIVKGILPGDTTRAHEELTKFTSEFDALLAAGNKGGASQRLGAEISNIKDKLQELDAVRRKTDEDDTYSIDREIESYKHLFDVLIQMGQAFDKMDAAQLKRNQAAKDEALEKNLADRQAEAQRNFQEDLAGVEELKTQRHAAFAEGKIDAGEWAQAQIVAANAAAEAQIYYKEQLLSIAKQGVDSSKIAAAAQDLATEKVRQYSKLLEDAATKTKAAQDAAQKIREEWDRQDFGAKKVEDATHALDELRRAEQRLAESQKNLKEAEITANYSAQEAEIERLAEFSVISEEEKEARLKTLYEKERGEAIGALLQQLDQEQAIVDKAQKDFESASSNPLFPDSQLADLKRNLDQAQIAYDNTHTQIIRVTDQYRQKLEGLSLAERMATAQELARARATQASLAAERAQIAANGGDTSAIDKEIMATKSYETELQRLLTRMTAVTKTKPTWDSFFSDLVNRSLKTGEAFKQMASLFADAMSSSVEAAVNGSEGFGEAMAQIVKSTLASLAGAAVGHVLTEIAKASSDFATAASLAADPFTAALAPGFIASAHAHLVAAAEWGAIGAGTAVGGAAIPGGGGSSSSGVSTGSEGPAAGSTAASAAPQPIQVQNVQHLGEGAVVSKRRLVVVGDDPRGGDQEEGILPLGNDRATGRIANAILRPLIAAFAGVPVSNISPELVADVVNPQPFTLGTVQVARQAAQLTRQAESFRSSPISEIHHHTYDQRTHVHVEMPIQGVISADTLDKVAPRIASAISKKVKSGEARLTASVSHRVTKRG